MHKTLAEIAQIVEGEVVGDKNLVITGLSGIQEAKQGDLSFVANSKYVPFIKTTKASALIVPRDLTVSGKACIRTDNPSLAFAHIFSKLIKQEPYHMKGVHPTAVIAPDSILGKNVAVGPYTVVENNVRIGDDTTIYSGCYIGSGTSIGHNSLIYPHVTILERVVIGNNVIIHSGTVVGSDGFGYEFVNGHHEKIPQTGTVIIEDEVEIGANVTIDRARFDRTFIGRGTKIDNLVQIAHNVEIGENCIIISQTGISGSVKIGKGAILAGQSGIVGHVTIGEGAIITAQAGVTKSVPPHTKVWGYPAKPHEQAKRVNAHLQRLPEYYKLLKELQQKLEALEKEIPHGRKTKNNKKRV